MNELCRETFRTVQQIVDGEVPPGPHVDVLVAHLERCLPCAAEADAVRQLKRAVDRICRDEGDELCRKLDPVLRRLLGEV